MQRKIPYILFTSATRVCIKYSTIPYVSLLIVTDNGYICARCPKDCLTSVRFPSQMFSTETTLPWDREYNLSLMIAPSLVSVNEDRIWDTFHTKVPMHAWEICVFGKWNNCSYPYSTLTLKIMAILCTMIAHFLSKTPPSRVSLN